MITYPESQAILREVASSRLLSSETLPLELAVARRAARDIDSPEAVPSFDNSAMDGFAIRSASVRHALSDHPATLHVLGRTLAGDLPASATPRIEDGAWQIMTGAPMPQGRFDAVVKVEEAELCGSGEIRIRRPLQPGENVRERGEDFKLGQRVLSAGTWIGPEHVMALAALGLSRIEVRARPRIAIISTGNELVHYATRELRTGQIRNSTAPFLLSAAPFLGAEARYYGSSGDTVADFLGLADRALHDRPDVVLTTGAVSMGTHDFIPAALEKLGAKTHFHKVAIRPGKPLLFATREQTAFFGCPGNPVSTVVALRFFVWPYLRALARQLPETPRRAILAEEVRKPFSFRNFLKANIETDITGTRVHALPGQCSFMVAPLLHANAWLALPEGVERVHAGSEVEFFSFYPELGKGANP